MGRDTEGLLWFLGWLVALAGLFAAGLRLPLATRRGRAADLAYAGGVVVLAVAVLVLANQALTRHDVHLDLTRERVFTPSAQAVDVVRALDRDVRLTYFYHSRDEAGRRGQSIVEALARESPRLHVRTVDPERQPRLAERYGIRVYNAAVVEADGRRIQVMGTDENDFALAIQRLLRRRVTTVCFMEGHGEYPFDSFEYHTHLETASSHTHGDRSSAVVQMPGHGAGRLRRAVEALGLETRRIVPATTGAIPADCAAVVAVNPRTTYVPSESEALASYLAGGGSALLLYDLGFVVEPHLAALLAHLGLRLPQDVVVDPRDHFTTDQEMVAVPVYEPHPVTAGVALTFFPGVRPLLLVPPPSGVKVTPLFLSSPDSYRRRVTPVGAEAITRAALAAPSAAPLGEKGREVLAAAVEGQWAGAPAGARPFRVVVVGDADFASNSFLPYLANADLALGMVRWLVREESAPRVRPAIPVPAMVLLTPQQMWSIFLGVEVLMPLAVIALGAVVWWRRR